jgi:hypothetical protein
VSGTSRAELDSSVLLLKGALYSEMWKMEEHRVGPPACAKAAIVIVWILFLRQVQPST